MKNPFMLRPLFAVGVSIAAGICVCALAGRNTAFLIATLIGAVVMATALYLRAPRKYAWLIISLLSFAGAGLFLAVRAERMMGTPCAGTLEGTVCALPRGSGESTRLLLKHCTLDGRAIEGKVLFYARGSTRFVGGEQIRAQQVELQTAGEKEQYRLWAKHARYQTSGEAVIMEEGQDLLALFGTIRMRMEEALRNLLDEQSFGTVKGMLFGDTSEMEEQTLSAFRATGIAHVLAVSGLHAGIVAAAVEGLLKKTRMSKWWRNGCVAVLLISYCALAGFTASVMRAAFMYFLGLTGRSLGEKTDLLSLLGVSAAVLLLFDPFQIFTVSFQMSFLAVLGIALFQEILDSMLAKVEIAGKHIWKPVRTGIAVSIAAQLGIVPVQLWVFGTLPTLTPVVNVLILPFVSVVVVNGMLAAMVGSLVLWIGAPFALLCRMAVGFMSAISRAASRIPYAVAVIGRPGFLAMLGLILILAALQKWNHSPALRKGMLTVAAAAIMASTIVGVYRSATELRVDFIDVGQGDAAFLKQGKANLLIDGGNNEYYDYGGSVVLPHLQRAGVDRLHAVVVTHPHADHCGGLISILEQVPVDKLIVGETKDADVQYERLMEVAKQKGIEIITVRAGERITLSDATLDIIGPRVMGSGNDASLVIAAQYAGQTALFTGDTERAGELAMLDILPKVQLLKVAHHGSDTSTCKDFLAKVKPDIAVISVGENNAYSLPSQAVLERLQSVGAVIYRTDLNGTLSFRIRGEGVYRDR